MVPGKALEQAQALVLGQGQARGQEQALEQEPERAWEQVPVWHKPLERMISPVSLLLRQLLLYASYL